MAREDNVFLKNEEECRVLCRIFLHLFVIPHPFHSFTSFVFLLQVFKFMSPSTKVQLLVWLFFFFQLTCVTKPLKNIMKTTGHLPRKKNKVRTRTYNILITGFFESLQVTKFNKILSLLQSSASCENEDSDLVGLGGV